MYGLWMDGWMDAYLTRTFQSHVCTKVLCVSLISQRFQLVKDTTQSLKHMSEKP